MRRVLAWRLKKRRTVLCWCELHAAKRSLRRHVDLRTKDKS
jgi:hypothetical protein